MEALNCIDDVERTIRNQSKLVMLFYQKEDEFSNQIITVLSMLAQDNSPKIHCVKVRAYPVEFEEQLRSRFLFSNMPAVCLFSQQLLIKSLSVESIPILYKMVTQFCETSFFSDSQAQNSLSTKQDSVDTVKKIQALIQEHPVLLFMKGSREAPFCRFSKKAIALLRSLCVNFSTYDILQDESMRQQLKIFSDWPTFPQLYVKGEFIGGVDIMEEMSQSGALESLLASYKLENGQYLPSD